METKDELKAKFETGDEPTGADFAELIDASVQDLSVLQPKGNYATTAQVGAKADKTYVDDSFQPKGSYATTAQVGGKADKTYVDTELGKKANATSLTSKADKTVVDDLIARVEALEGAGG